MAMIGVGLLSSPVLAQSLSFFGEIGGAPVFVSLDRTGDRLSGWYLYLRQARSIRLQGVIDANSFEMDEFSFVDGKKTRSFKGAPGEAGWLGNWRSPDGRQIRVSLRRDPDALSELSGRFHCETSVRESGYTFVTSLDLRAAKGKVTGLSLSHDATGGGDEQSCSIALSDLKQVRSDSGIVLRAREDDETDTSESAQYCTLHLLGGGDYVVALVDGCKGAGDTMFCSARGSWSDMVLNRRTQACKAIE
jgi:hypothetical protein